MTEATSFKSSTQSKPFTNGLVQVFTGNGRGKTSAALGTVMRASGNGLSSYVVFFMKGEYGSGEHNILSKLPKVTWAVFGRSDFFGLQDVTPEDKEQAVLALASARQAMLSGNYDLVVLDEVNTAVAWKIAKLDDVIRLIKDKPQNVELILTGRYADTKLVELADLVTEMVNIKHPYDKGIVARKGIDY